MGNFNSDYFAGNGYCGAAEQRRNISWESRDIIAHNTDGTPRYGTTTHGKQIGITYLIKVL